METKRNCKICEKQIKVHRQNSGYFISSEEGIFFSVSEECKWGVWFCNKCWELILERIKEQQKWKPT